MGHPHGDLRTSYRRTSPRIEALEGRQLLTSRLSQTPVLPPVTPQMPSIVHHPKLPNLPLVPGPPRVR
jgi:hypothetical protein